MDLDTLTPEQIDTLEHLSDEVRKGHPVSFMDGLTVVDYQMALKEQRKADRKWWQFWTWNFTLEVK